MLVNRCLVTIWRNLAEGVGQVDAEVAVVGAGVVGSAVALALATRGVSVALVEAESEPGLAASGTNSGILHTGFDSKPGELETALILRAGAIRDPVLDALGVPVKRCGGLLRPLDGAGGDAVRAIAANAARNGVAVAPRDDGALEVPGEAVTDPVAFTLAIAGAAQAHGAKLQTGVRVEEIRRDGEVLALAGSGSGAVRAGFVVNCAGLGAGEVASLIGDESFEVYPRKGEFLVFDPPDGKKLDRILLPVPERGTKGVLVFPTIDDKIVAGPTAHDQEDPSDWSVRGEARELIMPRAVAMFPPLEGAEPIAAYAGLRPAGRGVNYLIEVSAACGRFVNVAAIRSTGLTASLAIAERVCELLAGAGLELGAEEPLRRGNTAPDRGAWWSRTALYREARAQAAPAR
ncbi:MAG: NAD(P)/FAD-dependent oxidoreductase [Solirubrobacterales bacterium]